METAIIEGGAHLEGAVRIQGSKNTIQKIVPSTVAFPGVYRFTNVPEIHDTRAQLEILRYLGGSVARTADNLVIDTREMIFKEIPAHVAAQSTGTFLFAGALLTRFGEARVFHPGGDDIGYRGVTWHLDAFRSLGATVETRRDHYQVHASRLQGTTIAFKKPTVNGTVNAILASLKCEGETVLENTPTEPDIDNTVAFLNQAGAHVSVGLGTVSVRGGGQPTGAASLAIIPDRNDVATFAIAAALCGGRVVLSPVLRTHVQPLLDVFTTMGVRWEVISHGPEESLVITGGSPLRSVAIEAGTFPMFSTDWGPMIEVLMTQADGVSTLHELIFADRFKHVPHLERMGALIDRFQPDVSPNVYSFDYIEGAEHKHALRITGSHPLASATIDANDIRAGAALALAALVANGQSRLKNYEQVRRGYQDFAERLRALGASIRVVKEEDGQAGHTPHA